MTTTATSLPNAVTHLKAADPILARLIERVGECRFEASAQGTHFDAVVRAIVYQQLSTRAATVIHTRLQALFGNSSPRPAELLVTADADLRGIGLSRQKLAYLRDLATHVETGTLAIDSLHQLEDDAIIETLVRVKGVGRWTAQMFLIFRLGRLDVLPEGDLAIQKAIQFAYGLDNLPTVSQMRTIGEPWRPYATVASWYLWRSLD